MLLKRHILSGVWQLLSASEKKSGIWVIFLMMVQSIMDFFSLAAFLPLIIFLVNPGDSKIAGRFKFFLDNETGNDQRFVSALIGFIIIFFIVKLFISFWITHKKASFAYKAGNNIAAKSMHQYLQRPYLQYVNTDFTREMNRISNLPISFSNNILIPAGTLLAELGVAIMLVTGMALYDVKAFLFLLFIALPVGLIYSMNRKKINATGRNIKLTYPRLLKFTLQAIEGFPEIKTFGKESFFKERFKATNEELGETFARDHTFHAGTSRITELIAALGICSLIMYTALGRQDQSEAILLLSVYAGVSFRIIPSINRIFAAILQIRTHGFVVTELTGMTSSKGQEIDKEIKKLTFRNEIVLKNISYRYAEQFILTDTSLTIRKGEKIGIIGKSGAGKTTLFLILLRFLKEADGEIYLDNNMITETDNSAFRKLIGYVPQNPYILDASLAENIAFGTSPEKIDMYKVEKIIQQMNLHDWVRELPEKMNTIIGEKGTKISGGQRQRIAIARALYHESELLLLDEVTNQLDPVTELEVFSVFENLATENKTMIMITHHPDLLERFDAVYEIKNTRFQKVSFSNTFSSPIEEK